MGNIGKRIGVVGHCRKIIQSMNLSLIEFGKKWKTHLFRGTMPENDSKQVDFINEKWEIMGNAFESWDIAGK